MRRFMLALCALSFAVPAQAKWFVAETAHFTVYADSKAEETKAFAEQLERFDMALRFMQNMPIETERKSTPLTIYRFGDTDDMAILAGAPDSGIAGFFIPRASGSVAFVPERARRARNLGARTEDDGDLDAETILFHEYVHHFMFQHFSAAYPAWYIEGFAELYSTTQLLPDGVFRVGLPANHRGAQLFYDTPFPVKKLFAAKIARGDNRHYYSVGWLLTHYLSFSPDRKGQLRAYLNAVNTGATSEAAAKEVFGDLDALNKEVMRYLKSRLQGFEVKPANYAAPKVSVRPLNADETAIIAPRIRSHRGVDKKSAPRIANEIRTKGQPYAGSSFVQLALAEAEYDAGNLDASEAAGMRALAVDPASADAMNYVGLVHLKRGEKTPESYATARQWFVKAKRAKPAYAPVLINHYLSYSKAGATIPEPAIIDLEHAFELAPFDTGLRFLLTRQLLTEKRGKPARSVIEPVAFSAHGGGIAKRATKVLEHIDKNELTAALALIEGQIKRFDSQEEEEDDDDDDDDAIIAPVD